jgi:glycosyltransferase involved in cell wall biosynthesis
MKTILLLTLDISPYRGSEANSSWNYVKEISKDNRLTVIYGKDKSEIENYMKTNHLPNVSFHHIEIPKIEGKGLIYELKCYRTYRNWHKSAYETAKEIIKNETIDIVHYLNPTGFKEPGFLWKLEKPYIWGPIQGVHPRPYCLSRGLKQRTGSVVRNIILKSLFHLSARLGKAVKRTDVLLSATTESQSQFQSVFNKKNGYLPENGIWEIENQTPIAKNASEKLRLVWIGSLCVRKNLKLLLAVLSDNLKNSNQWELNILGKGEQEEILKTFAREQGIDRQIIWHGHVPREQVQEIIRNSHLHIITSLGEGTPTVIWETLAKGIPTLTLDHCGMADMVCEKCGIKIPIHSYKQVVHDIGDHLTAIIKNPQEIGRLSQGVIECAQKYTWDKRREFFNRQYEAAMENYRRKSLMT